MTPQQREALKQALEQHSLKMAVKDAAPEDVAALPQDFTIPSYNENNKPLYDNQLFPAVNSVEDLVARGYATPDGQVTENGQMALSLKKVGALNDDYTLNDTGKAMMASRQDLLKEENLPLYMKSKEIGLDDTGELSWGEVGTNFLNQLKEGGKNLIDLASFDTSSMTPEQQAEFQLKSQAAVSGFAKAGATLATGAAKIAGTGTIQALVEDEDTQKTAKALLDQKVERVSDDINNTNTAEFIDALGEMSGVNLNLQEGREQAIALVGEEKAQEFERAGESAGGFASMFNPYGPSMLTAKVAFGAASKGLGAAFKPISRSLLQADAKAAEVLAKTKQLATLERQAAGLQLATQTAEKQAVLAENMAQKFSQAGFTDRANNALRLANQARTKGQEAAARLGGFTDEIATVSDDLAKVTQSATVADKVLQMTQKASQVPYLPITLLGKSLEYTGRGMIGIDKGLASMASKVGADKVYNAMNKITTLSGLGGVGAASGLGPAAFIPAAIKATWSTAPFIKATGEYIGLMGKEAMKARGQIGFWKRMYEMPNKGPMHRAVSGLMDTATLGGRVTGAAGRVGKGLAASYPVDLAFEWVAEGGEMNPNVLKQAAVETLVFGGTGAALGGITMGSAERIRSLQNGDATNFYRSLTDPSQRVMFNGMAPDLKRAIGTFSASNPGAKIEFITQGEGAYDRNTKTVMVNPTSRNPLKPLLTHEFMHHMLNNGIGDGVVAQLVGDGYQTGGILRSKDGGYEPQYEAFKNEYVNRLRQQHERNIKMRDAIGDPVSKSEREFQVPDEKYLAEEYFIETNVEDMLGLVESGKLGKMAGRMVLNDKVRALGDAILNKSAILRDLHFRIGGVMDKQGKMVKGNGFLGGQLYQSPEIRRMFKKMVNESVGRRGGIDSAKMKARNGIELPITGKNDPILGEMSSLWESDADGNPLLDKNGDYVPLSKQTDELRSQAGMLLVDDLRARQARGEVIPDGELAYNPDNNTWSGQYLNDRQIDLLALSGRFNSKQIKQLKLMNEAAKATSDPNADPASRGHRFSVIYQPALKKNRKGQWRYDQIKPQLRDVVPYGVEISKDGNILIRIMSTNQLFANVSEKATTKRGRSLYDGNMDAILRDANAVIDLHGKNQATDAYFKDKYGAQWASHKEFINSVFGNVGKGHKDINPLVASDRVDAVVKSYRLDRMNKATQLVGATQLPYQNNLIKINYLPEGEPILDENGEPKDLRYTPRAEERMPEQRQIPEVSPEDLNPVANRQEAEGLFADGKRMFAINEMDGTSTEITSASMLNAYPPDAIGWMEPEQATAPSQRFMPEKEIPVAKTTSESLEDSENKELISTGVDVPESVDDQSVISNAIKVANSQPWRKGRDFKLDLQRRVLDAAKQAGVNISERTLESIEYLARVGFKDALIALEQNPNAIGWYDEKTKQALGVMSLLFPEIATNENARFAFTWALAVTSNGLKVDKNFELAERVYRQYRKTGKMPTDIKAGQAQEAINDGLGLFNKLTKEWGVDNTRKFMQTDFTVGEISRLSKDLSPGGEFSDTSVRGSAILGPKIGNGFFSNLYGLFDALTMDRWLVRTWGRWTGTLVELNPELTKQATDRLQEAVKNLTPEDKARMDEMIKNDISKMDINDLSVAIQKASMKPSLRDLMNKTTTGEEFRKSGNGLAKYLDGQKEAPANPAERNFIREIFGLMLDELRADPRYKDLTMADLQAVLWYAEKRLYETAKVNTNQKDLDSSDADGYEDDEAPDYANAAVGVAKKQGISEKRINQILEKVKNERTTTTQLEVEGRGEDQLRQQESAGGFAGKEKQKFKQYVAVTTTRRNRTGNEKALWSYQTKSGVDSGDAGLLKPKAKKNLGVKYISEWKPGRKLATIFRNNNLPTVKFLELDSTDTVSAQKFADTIQQSKDESPHGAAVYVYPTEEYQGMKLFLSDSGKSGFAVKPDGDIVSVFSMEKGSGRSIMEAAISAGGKKLDAFDTVLPEFYGTHGFVEAARMPWNDEFAPDGWDKQAFKEFNNGEPDVVMMVLDPSFDGEYTPRKDIYTTDYDQAVEMQDAMLKKVGRKKLVAKPSQPAPQKTTKKSTAKGNSSAIANAAKLK